MLKKGIVGLPHFFEGKGGGIAQKRYRPTEDWAGEDYGFGIGKGCLLG
jgi:hypothetical protein